MKKAYTIFVLVVILLAFGFNVAPSYSAKKALTPAQKFYRRISKNRSNNRNDYPSLSDAEFANFREVKTTGIAEGKLYRSSSPINDWGNRHLIADELSQEHGIKTFINLVDSNEGMRSYKGFAQTYYSGQAAIALNMNLKFLSKDFQNKVARGVKFIARNEPPFLIHCNLGKDRTGLFCAIIEALMGATPDEISEDYATSFYNYFGVKLYSSDYYFVVNNEIRPFLASILGVKDIDNVNLPAAAERYLLRVGVSAEEIKSIRAKLGQP